MAQLAARGRMLCCDDTPTHAPTRARTQAHTHVYTPKTHHMRTRVARTSYGVACCQFCNNIPEILLICKRYTYAYGAITCGYYNSADNAGLIKMFSGMTNSEKYDIVSLNFAQVWYRTGRDMPSKPRAYFIAKNKFENTFVADGGVRLRRLLSRSTSANEIWEIPKGRKKNKDEPDIHCAMREFQEETGVARKNYKLFPQATRSHTYVDDGVKYTSTYYFGIARNDIIPYVNFASHKQTSEVADVRWASIAEVRRLDPSGRLESMVAPIFNYIKKYGRD